MQQGIHGCRCRRRCECRCRCSRAAPSASRAHLVGIAQTGSGLCATSVEPDVLRTRWSSHPCHLRSVIPSADRGRQSEANVTGPDGKNHVLHRPDGRDDIPRPVLLLIFIFLSHGPVRWLSVSTSRTPFHGSIYTYCRLFRSPVPRGQHRHSGATRHRNAAASNCNGTGLVSHWQGPSSRFPDRLARIISSPTTRHPWLSAGPSRSCSTGEMDPFAGVAFLLWTHVEAPSRVGLGLEFESVPPLCISGTLGGIYAVRDVARDRPGSMGETWCRQLAAPPGVGFAGGPRRARRARAGRRGRIPG